MDGVFHELAEMGAPVPEFGDVEVVEGRLADVAIDEASARLNEPALALVVAERLAIGSLGEIDYALCTSDTLRVGLGRLARFYRLATERVGLELEERGAVAALVFRATAGAAYSRHWREIALAIVARRIRQTVGQRVRFRDVAFAHAAPARTEPYASFFGGPVRFGADADRLGFTSELLDRPLRTAAAALGDLLEAKMKELSPRDDDAFVARARRAVSAQIDARDLDIASTAKRLATSTRTLQRTLERAKTSHRALVDDVRRERALALLEAGTPVADISARLGFSDTRAFFRAFRRWTGTSPSALRDPR